MTIADYVQRTMKANFGAAWEELVSSIVLPKVHLPLLEVAPDYIWPRC